MSTQPRTQLRTQTRNAMNENEFHLTLTRAVREACEADVEAFKPGNVSRDAPGHGMQAEQFLASAAAIASPISAPNLSVGERILSAIEATRQVVATNTNLGIVLLAAPLVHAAWQRGANEGFVPALERVLEQLTLADAQLAYQAIRLAQPGGLGSVEHHDISQEPAVTLLAAMQTAAERDTIALQYASGYRLVLELGLACLNRALARGMSQHRATLACYLALLARVPDSLIVRKHGYRVAREVSLQAAPFMQALEDNHEPQSLLPRLQQWDRELKANGINPGTCADLTVAALLASKLLHLP
jgi:triphosphoribosyl-dephospho-CoA synthase